MGERVPAGCLSRNDDAARPETRYSIFDRPRGSLQIVRSPSLQFAQEFNQRHLAKREFDDELLARVQAYELAFRMQTAAPGIVDLKGETRKTLQLYGIDKRETAEFGTRCLLARRMIERGGSIRSALFRDTNGWDAHKTLPRITPTIVAPPISRWPAF